MVQKNRSAPYAQLHEHLLYGITIEDCKMAGLWGQVPPGQSDCCIGGVLSASQDMIVLRNPKMEGHRIQYCLQERVRQD